MTDITGNIFTILHEHSFAIKAFAATAILAWAVFEDLRTRKFFNRSFLIASAIAVLVTLLVSEASALLPATLGFASGIVLFLPLVSMGVVGAGDMKLMAAVGILIGWNAVLWSSVYGIVWGGIFGLAQIAARGHLKLLGQNLTTLTVLRTKAGVELHHIPFTAPLLLGWLSHLVLLGVL